MISTDKALTVSIIKQQQSWPSINRYLILEGVCKRVTRGGGLQDRQQRVGIRCECSTTAGSSERLSDPATGSRREYRATPDKRLGVGEPHGKILGGILGNVGKRRTVFSHLIHRVADQVRTRFGPELHLVQTMQHN